MKFHEICPNRQTLLKIAFIRRLPYFALVDSKIDMDTMEGILIGTFLEKHGLAAEWHDANSVWGNKDPNGTWNGMVGKVGYYTCDVGITAIYYTHERLAIIDFSFAVGDAGLTWVSKIPQKLPPATNIVRIFDKTSWLLIFISMMTTSFMLQIASRAGLAYGVGTADIISVFLTPFQTLNAEYLPAWFNRRRNRRFFSPGFTGNYLLLMWAVLGNLITMALLCNIRAMLMKPVFEKPIDSTKDLIIVGKIPTTMSTGFWIDYLKTSSNEWERLAGETGDSFKTKEEENSLMIEKVYEAESHVFLNSPVYTLNFLDLEYFKDKERPVFHISRERLR